MRQEPLHRGILGIDIQRFSRREWTDPTKARLRDRLHRLLDEATAHVEVDRSLTDRIDTGDGLWLLVGTAVSTVRLLRLAAALAVGLSHDNRQAPPGERVRLRVAMHTGAVLRDRHGYTGDSLIHVARILDAPIGRAILDGDPAIDLVLLVSEQVYQDVVRHDYPGIDSARYQPVRVRRKETRTRAWAFVPDPVGIAVD
jgi:hypothetical protein